MTREEILEKANHARKPEKIFDSDRYSISKIALNYRIYIKLPKRSQYQAMERDCYAPLEYGLDYAHDTAEEMIMDYFSDYKSS